MFVRLLSSRRFAPLFWCQLCSALNDNFLKNSLAMLILFGLPDSARMAGERQAVLITLSGVVFIAPFFLLSALGGELADRYDKALVARSIRLAEIPIAALAAVGFFVNSVPILFVALGPLSSREQERDDIGAEMGPFGTARLGQEQTDEELGGDAGRFSPDAEERLDEQNE